MQLTFPHDSSKCRNLSRCRGRNHGGEAVWWLALRFVISFCFYTVQTQPRDGNTLYGLDPLHHAAIKKNALLDKSIDQSMV